VISMKGKINLEIDEIFYKKVVPSGTSGIVWVGKKHIGKQAIVIIPKETPVFHAKNTKSSKSLFGVKCKKCGKLIDITVPIPIRHKMKPEDFCQC